jgi:hypothetical protein
VAAVANVCRYRKKPSHYVYGELGTVEIENGGFKKEIRPIYIRINPKDQEYIYTYAENHDSQTLLFLTFDLDYEKAFDVWKKDGLLDVDAILAFLEAFYPLVFKYLAHVTRSNGGRGLGLALAISPLELGEHPEIEKLGRMVQARLISLLNSFGMGADPAAKGLKRAMPNFKNPKSNLYTNFKMLTMLSWARPPVLSEMLELLSFTFILPPVLFGISKHFSPSGPISESKERDLDNLYPRANVELAFAKLMVATYDEGGTIGGLSREELSEISGIGKNFPIEGDWLCGLSVIKLHGDWSITVDLGCHDYIARAFQLLGREPVRKPRDLSSRSFEINPESLCRPEFVLKGERNYWLTSAGLILKWDESVSDELMSDSLQEYARCIPGFLGSKNCRQVLGKVKSLLRHFPWTRGMQGPGYAPSWLIEPNLLQPKDLTEFPFLPRSTTLRVVQPDESAGEGEAGSEISLKEELNYNSVEGSGENPRRDLQNPAGLRLVSGERGKDAPGASGESATEPEAQTPKDAAVEASSKFAQVAQFTEEEIEFLRATGGLSEEEEAYLKQNPPKPEEAVTPVRLELPAQKFANLHSQRKEEFLERDPLERFFVDLVRCQAKNSLKSIFEILLKAHFAMESGRICKANILEKGNPYRRVVRSFLMLTDTARERNLEEINSEL